MKKLIRVLPGQRATVGVCLVFIVLANIPSLQAQIIVPARSRWIDTRIQVEAGTLIQLSATGTIQVGSGLGAYGPTGTPGPHTAGFPTDLPYVYGLVARLTDSFTDPTDDLREDWAYGRSASYYARSAGHLWLTVNDDNLADNTGQFSVTVTLTRPTTWDFEIGNTRGWTRTGTAFESQPTFGNNVVVRRPGTLINQQGNYWIGTYENRPSAAVPNGTVQGDAPTGTLTSDAFTIRGGNISFLIGGGNDLNRLRVELLIKVAPGEGFPTLFGPGRIPMPDGDYVLAYLATGRNSEVMRRENFALGAAYLNRTARIRLVDNASQAWGHLNVDDFQFGNQPPGDVWITGMEVVQAVQTYPIATVPLVGGKKTLVRVYVQARNDDHGAWTDVTARLTVRKGPIIREHAPLVATPGLTLTVPTTGSQRERNDDSFSFLLDYDETLPGEGELEVRIRSLSDRADIDLTNNVRLQRVQFGPTRNYEIYGATYSTYSTTNPNGNQAAPPWSDFEVHRSYTENVMPVSNFLIRPLLGHPTPRFNWNVGAREGVAHDDSLRGEAYTWAVDLIARQPDGDNRGLYMLMPDNTCHCGVEYPGPRVMFGHNLRSVTDAGAIMAHEVGHFFGMAHVQTTPLGPTAYPPYEAGYPYPSSWMGPAVGVQFPGGAVGMPRFAIIPPGTSGTIGRYDIMSYGHPAWISDYTYLKWMASDLFPTPGGRMGLEPTPTAGNSAGPAVTPSKSPPAASLAQSSTAGRIGKEAHAPAVRWLVTGKGWDGKSKQVLAWEAHDLDGDRLTYSVDYSLNGGQTWFPLDGSLTEKSLVVDFANLPGSDQAALRVVAHDGLLTGEARLLGLRVARKMPQVVLALPEGAKQGEKRASDAPFVVSTGEQVVWEGQPLLVSGHAFDWEDGFITEASGLHWRSDRDGELGRGPWIVVGKLSPGKHTITLTATDSDQMAGSASFDILVKEVKPLTNKGAIPPTNGWSDDAPTGTPLKQAREGVDGDGEFLVQVLGNPLTGEQVRARVRGAGGRALTVELINLQGQVVARQWVEQAASVQEVVLRVGDTAGMYLLRARTATQGQTQRVLKIP